MKGLEPPRLTAPDPKSGAAANYATSAYTVTCVAAIDLGPKAAIPIVRERHIRIFKTERKFIDYSQMENNMLLY
jgi:hypothetical protein